MLADLRSALHQARRHPWYFGGAALSLAIGMFVATAVFSVVDAVLIQPLPYHDPSRIVHVTETVPYVGGRYDNAAILSRHTVAAMAARSFSDVAAVAQAGVRVTTSEGGRYLSNDVQLGGGEAPAAQGARVTTNFLSLLGVRPVMGRDFTPDDGLPGAMSVIISHRMWSTQFGADTSLVGREIMVAGAPHRVIGVMREGFNLPGVDLWLPLRFSTIDSAARAEKDNDLPPYRVLARLAPGVDVVSASAELATLYARDYEETWRSLRSSRVVPLQEMLADRMAGAMQLWSAIALLIALLCAVNFATISLARGIRRRAEIAVRSAMGASTVAVIRMLVAEAVMIACAGGVLALVFATWLLQLAGKWLATGEILARPIASWTTIGFAVAATIVVGVLFALAPAVELARVDLRSRLQRRNDPGNGPPGRAAQPAPARGPSARARAHGCRVGGVPRGRRPQALGAVNRHRPAEPLYGEHPARQLGAPRRATARSAAGDAGCVRRRAAGPWRWRDGLEG